MIIQNYRRQRAEVLTGLKLDIIPENESHIIGHTYYCGYWGYIYKVLDVSGRDVTIEREGQTVTHSTPLNKLKDFKVIV